MIDLKDAVKECRAQILLDLDASDFRWPDALMVGAANATLHEIFRKRPILLYTATNDYRKAEDLMIPKGSLDGGGTFVIQIPDRFREALVHGMAARCFNGDANNQTDAQRMAYEKARFDELMNV